MLKIFGFSKKEKITVKDLASIYSRTLFEVIDLGFSEIIEFVNEYQINNLDACKDLKDLHFRKGQLSIISSLLNLEEGLKTAKEQAEQEEVEAFEEEDSEVSKSDIESGNSASIAHKKELKKGITEANGLPW